MKSSLFRLDVRDLVKGLAVAVLAVVLGAMQQALADHGLDLAAYNWSGIIEIAATAGISYLAKNFLSSDDDKLLGRF